MHPEFVECTSDNSLSFRQKVPIKDRTEVGTKKDNLDEDTTIRICDLMLGDLEGI